jgi:hypothetical protein
VEVENGKRADGLFGEAYGACGGLNVQHSTFNFQLSTERSSPTLDVEH